MSHTLLKVLLPTCYDCVAVNYCNSKGFRECFCNALCAHVIGGNSCHSWMTKSHFGWLHVVNQNLYEVIDNPDELNENTFISTVSAEDWVWSTRRRSDVHVWPCLYVRHRHVKGWPLASLRQMVRAKFYINNENHLWISQLLTTDFDQRSAKVRHEECNSVF